MSKSTELLSVTLEIIAFFFVTIDLYGRARLQATTERIATLTEWLSAAVLRYARGAIRIEMLGVSVLDGLPVLGVLLLYAVFAAFGFGLGFLGIAFDRHPGPVFSALAGILVYLGFSSAVFFTTMILLYVLSGLVILVNRIVQRLEFEGILLLVGTVLFVIAKGMVWLHLLHEVRHG